MYSCLFLCCLNFKYHDALLLNILTCNSMRNNNYFHIILCSHLGPFKTLEIMWSKNLLHTEISPSIFGMYLQLFTPNKNLISVNMLHLVVIYVSSVSFWFKRVLQLILLMPSHQRVQDCVVAYYTFWICLIVYSWYHLTYFSVSFKSGDLKSLCYQDCFTVIVLANFIISGSV